MGRSEQSPLASRSPPLAAAMEGQAAPPTRGHDRAVAVLRHLPSNVVRARGQAGTVPRSLQGRSESRWPPRRRSRSTPAGSAGSLDARHSSRCSTQSAARWIIELRESGAAPRSDAVANDAGSALSKPAVGGGARGARLLQLINAGARRMLAPSATPRSGGGSRCSSRRLWPSCSRRTRAVSSAWRQPTSRTFASVCCGYARKIHTSGC